MPASIPTLIPAPGTHRPECLWLANSLSFCFQVRKTRACSPFVQQLEGLRGLMPLKQLWWPLGKDILTWLLTILGPLDFGILACKVDLSCQFMVNPQQMLNISVTVVIIAPALSPTVPWDLDGNMEHSWGAKRRGKG